MFVRWVFVLEPMAVSILTYKSGATQYSREIGGSTSERLGKRTRVANQPLQTTRSNNHAITIPWRPVFDQKPVFDRFLRPARSPKLPQKCKITDHGEGCAALLRTKFSKWLCQAVWRRSGTVLGYSGDPPGGFLRTFWGIFLEKVHRKNLVKNLRENLA